MNKQNLCFYIICTCSIFILMCIGVGMFLKNNKIFQAVDNELYYYGLNRLDKYDYIVQNIRPIGSINDRLYGEDYPFEGVYLIDKEQWFLDKGGKSGSITVDSLCSYGFNDHMLVTEVISDQGMRYYVVADFNNSHNSTEIQIDTSGITNPTRCFDLDRWIYDVNNPPKNLCAISNYCIDFFFMIVLSEIILIALFIMFVTNIIKSYRHY